MVHKQPSKADHKAASAGHFDHAEKGEEIHADKPALQSAPPTALPDPTRQRHRIRVVVSACVLLVLIGSGIGLYFAEVRLSTSGSSDSSSSTEAVTESMLSTAKPTPAPLVQAQPDKTASKSDIGQAADGSRVIKYTLKNTNGMQVTLLSHGARIVSVLVPSGGRLVEVALNQQPTNLIYFYVPDNRYGVIYGAVNGPVCTVTMWSLSYAGLTYNIKPHAVSDLFYANGGYDGFYLANFQQSYADTKDQVHFIYNGAVSALNTTSQMTVTGNYTVHVIYQLTQANELTVTTTVDPQIQMPVDVCSSVAFNLGGQNPASLEDHTLFFPPAFEIFDHDDFWPSTSPTGNDYITFYMNSRQIEYDFTFVFNTSGPAKRLVARLQNDATRIKLEIYSDQPALRCRIPNLSASSRSMFTWMAANNSKLSGTLFWFQPQEVPLYARTDAPSVSKLMVKPGSPYQRQTTYAFSSP